MSNDSVNDFLFSGGAKSFPFENVGDTIKGEIVSADLRQQTSIEGQLLTWTDGSPRMQLVIVVHVPDLATDDDDGNRSIYAKGGRYDVASGSGQSMRDAIAEAVRDAGAKSLDPGDEIAVSFTGLGKAKRGQSAPKLYTAGYRKATASVAAADLFGD